jgi:methylated-DNA-[protein]-cysteine S-methyltransferase
MRYIQTGVETPSWRGAMPLFLKTMPSPVGLLRLVANPRGLVAILWENDDPKRVRLGDTAPASDHPILLQAERELQDYFAGRRMAFNVPLDPSGTEFQSAVWDALAAIPYGETLSYGALAARIGKPSAARAAGAAIGRNPLSIITPCHRAVGANGDLTGFAGGLAAKRFLLAIEARAGASKRGSLLEGQGLFARS